LHPPFHVSLDRLLFVGSQTFDRISLDSIVGAVTPVRLVAESARPKDEDLTIARSPLRDVPVIETRGLRRDRDRDRARPSALW
jgi:hypothetical protein